MSNAVKHKPPAMAPVREQVLERLLVEVRARRAEFATKRRLSDDVVRLLTQAGVFRSPGGATVRRRRGQALGLLPADRTPVGRRRLDGLGRQFRPRGRQSITGAPRLAARSRKNSRTRWWFPSTPSSPKAYGRAPDACCSTSNRRSVSPDAATRVPLSCRQGYRGLLFISPAQTRGRRRNDICDCSAPLGRASRLTSVAAR